jgi:1-acyl-sn-glycerol-3-phosphate acyltransferase
VTDDRPSAHPDLHIPAGHERGERLSATQRAGYTFVRNVLAAAFKLYFRVEVVGRDRFPSNGGVIVSASHRSNLDTPIICVITKRRLRYMGKESLWKSKFGGWFLTSLGGFPVTRGSADREALRAAMAVAERGEPLVMFPEGTRRTGPKIEDANMHDGPAYVACRTGVPILPVGMAGTEAAMPKGSKFVRPAKVVIVLRDPIHPPATEPGARVPRRVVREMSELLRDEVQLAFDEARARAGFPDGY